MKIFTLLLIAVLSFPSMSFSQDTQHRTREQYIQELEALVESYSQLAGELFQENELLLTRLQEVSQELEKIKTEINAKNVQPINPPKITKKCLLTAIGIGIAGVIIGIFN